MDDAKPNVREPRVTDGSRISELIGSIGVLDKNSTYCYLMICEYFRATSAVATVDGELGGFISAFVEPDHPNTLFVWQVAVNPQYRRRGMAMAMLNHILARPICRDISYVETTVSPSNHASTALFEGLAKRQGTSVQRLEGFQPALFSDATHEAEPLLRIGPIQTALAGAM